MSKKLIIAGGTGFIGEYLNERFSKSGYDVIIISRKNGTVHWNDEKRIIVALEDSSMLINLAGKSINCRFTERNKKKLISSRIETTKILGEAILKCNHPPELWLNVSGASVYRDSQKPMSENGEIGTDFLADLAFKWEKTFYSFQLSNTRQIVLRLAIVLGKNGGVLKPFSNLVKFGLGGRQGSGNQMFSWIHLEDLFSIISFLTIHEEINGVINCSSPNAVTNKTLMKTLREVLTVRIGIPSYEWMLRIGAFIIGTEPELVLKSQWIYPEKLLNAGYVFKHAELKPALKNILQ